MLHERKLKMCFPGFYLCLLPSACIFYFCKKKKLPRTIITIVYCSDDTDPCWDINSHQLVYNFANFRILSAHCRMYKKNRHQFSIG